MSVECRDWMDNIEQQLKSLGIDFAKISDSDITDMFWRNLTVAQAVREIQRKHGNCN